MRMSEGDRCAHTCSDSCVRHRTCAQDVSGWCFGELPCNETAVTHGGDAAEPGGARSVQTGVDCLLCVQLNRALHSASITRFFDPWPEDADILVSEPIVDGGSFAVTVMQASFTQGANPTKMNYTNTTLWCAPSRRAAAPLIKESFAYARENGPTYLDTRKAKLSADPGGAAAATAPAPVSGAASAGAIWTETTPHRKGDVKSWVWLLVACIAAGAGAAKARVQAPRPGATVSALRCLQA
jgi:hypothetical protein